ncbi:glycerophosphodiester phosphodiesterase family protein [Chitinophaga sp. NPDC101104]|uniref:glycerophosphodiester phosphodiesterase family protein n=1 Tax=Chitinophaga sp. NPDC101104 TaxID=3390561 RepID=UPI003CFC34B0
MKGTLIFAGCLLLHGLGFAQQPALPAQKHGFVVIAHRGNHETVPENTVASVEAAYQCGADYAELDLRTTQDGHLVLMHDATVDRTTNGKGAVAEYTLAALRRLTINSTDGKIYRVPTFTEALKAARDKVHIYLDFKEADVAQAWQQIREAGMEKQVIVYINKKEQYQPWREIAPQMPLMSSLPDDAHTPAQMEQFLDTYSFAVLDNITDSSLMNIARRRRVSVWLDAQSPNEGPDAWKAVLDRKVQGMQSDHPGALVRYLREHKLRGGPKK